MNHQLIKIGTFCPSQRLTTRSLESKLIYESKVNEEPNDSNNTFYGESSEGTLKVFHIQ